MPDQIVVKRIIPARPERIFEAWLSEEEHSKMTGSFAQQQKDGVFVAWDGYITAKTLEKQPFSKIVQSWRTTEFPAGSSDSMLTVSLEPTEGGTQITIEHTNIPEGQGESYEGGWNDFYFDPMERYFGSSGQKLQDASDALEEAAAKAGEAVEEALDAAQSQLDDAAKKAIAVVATAKKGAQRQALKAVKAAKGVQKKAAKTAKGVKAKAVKAAKSVAKKVKALGKKAAPAKKAAKKAAPKKAAKKKSKSKR
jgi:uncharacterized protein YndB with AHSA1/START domain